MKKKKQQRLQISLSLSPSQIEDIREQATIESRTLSGYVKALILVELVKRKKVWK